MTPAHPLAGDQVNRYIEIKLCLGEEEKTYHLRRVLNEEDLPDGLSDEKNRRLVVDFERLVIGLLTPTPTPQLDTSE